MPDDNLPVQSGKGHIIGPVIAAAVAIAVPVTSHFEGEVHHTYRDPGGVATYCIGETTNIDWSRIYTHDECASLMRTRLAHDYAPAILRCTPPFADPKHKGSFAMSIDASYNAGAGAFCKSPMHKLFMQGKWKEGCAAFKGWYITQRINGKPTVLPGLVARRNAEAATCLTGE